MSTAASSDVHWLCPSCDAEPSEGPSDGICTTCGSRLIEVRTRAEDLTGLVVDGRFEIRSLLGQGGMGAVYRSWQRSVGREVAIKLIDERHGRDPMAVRRFLREARLASQLSQPNTVSVLDFGQSSDGRLFIAMELVRGRTLAEVLAADGPFSPSRAAWIGVQLCDALDAAHRLQIIHRDLKPANVVVLDDPPGRDLIKVLDFGLAKSLAESETKATDTGLVVGTPRYMAPEMILGERPTAQSDLYAVGVILGELSTGKLMWDATSFPALAGQKLQGSVVLHEIPLGLRGVVSRLIDPDVSKRPASASEVRALLRPVATDNDISERSSRPLPVVDSDETRGGDDAPGPSRPGTMAPPIDPTMPLAQVTAPGSPAARRAADPLTSARTTATPRPEPKAVAAAVSAASVKPSRSTPSTDEGEVVARRGGRGRLVLGAGILAVAAIALIVVLPRGGDEQAAEPAAGSVAGPALTVDAAAAGAGSVVATGSGTGSGLEPIVPVDPGSGSGSATPVTTTVVFAVRSRPVGAEILIDGKPSGVTPKQVEVARGDGAVRVEVRSRGLTARPQPGVPDQDRSFDFTLRRPRGGHDRTPF